MIIHKYNERLCMAEVPKEDLISAPDTLDFLWDNDESNILKAFITGSKHVAAFVQNARLKNRGILLQREKRDDTLKVFFLALSEIELYSLGLYSDMSNAPLKNGGAISTKYLEYVMRTARVNPEDYIRNKTSESDENKAVSQLHMSVFYNIDALMDFFTQIKITCLPIYKNGNQYEVISILCEESDKQLSMLRRIISEFEDDGYDLTEAELACYMEHNEDKYLCDSKEIIRLVSDANAI